MQSNLDDEFWRFVYERQEIWHRRNVLKLPVAKWYEGLHPVFRQWKFCNIYPELDRGSIFIQNECKDTEGAGEPIEVAVFKIIVYRLFNSIPAYQALSDNNGVLPECWDEDEASKVLHECAKTKKVFGGAFMITGAGNFKTSSDKIDIMCRDVIGHLLENDKFPEKTFGTICKDIPNWQNVGDVVRTLSSNIRYCGEFLAYVMCQDIVRTGLVNFDMDSDYDIRWTIGARKGITLLSKASLERKEATERVKAMAQKSASEFSLRGLQFKYLNGKKLGILEIENSLCEYQKFYVLAHPQSEHHAKIRRYSYVEEKQ
jgi:hypothetical protein